MKKSLFAVSLLVSSTLVVAQDLPRPSPKSTFTQQVGLSEVSITYSRPSVKGRAIWGALVPYDKVWRTGANEQTIFKISDDAMVQGMKLAAGSYSLHTIPGKEEWTLIFNSAANPSGNYSYDAAKDALRVKVKPRVAEMTEMMTFSVPTVTRDEGIVTLQWEKLDVPFSVKFDTVTKTMAGLSKAVSEAKADDWRTAYRAADFAFQNNAGDASAWLDRSIAVQANVPNLSLKARMLAKAGKKKEAIAAAEKAIALGKAATPPADTTALAKELADWKKK